MGTAGGLDGREIGKRPPRRALIAAIAAAKRRASRQQLGFRPCLRAANDQAMLSAEARWDRTAGSSRAVRFKPKP